MHSPKSLKNLSAADSRLFKSGAPNKEVVREKLEDRKGKNSRVKGADAEEAVVQSKSIDCKSGYGGGDEGGRANPDRS